MAMLSVWPWAVACLLSLSLLNISDADGSSLDDQSFLRKLLAARAAGEATEAPAQICTPPNACVPADGCAGTVVGGENCEDEYVCCAPDVTMADNSESESSDKAGTRDPDLPASTDNVSESLDSREKVGEEPKIDFPEDQQSLLEDTDQTDELEDRNELARSAYGVPNSGPYVPPNSGYGVPNSRPYGSEGSGYSFHNAGPYGPYNSGSYGSQNSGYGSQSTGPRGSHNSGYGYNSGSYGFPRPYPQQGHGGGYPPHSARGQNRPYPPPPPYVSYNHIYESDYGSFAPDYYGPRYDVTGLSVPARDVLHKYRFREQCGIKPIDVFPDLPYGAPRDPYRRAPPAQFARNPWQAAVLGWSREGGYGLRCSATVVHRFLLITSAHCLSGIIEPELKVLLGVSDLLARRPFLPAIERAVARIFVHEKYDSRTLSHDVALLQLSSPINFHFTPHVAPACLPQINQTFIVNNCYILGWTDRETHRGQDVQTNEIQITDMKFVSDTSHCQKQVSQLATQLDPYKMTKEMHCVKGSSESSCLGSSGGALFCDVPSIPTTDKCPGHNCPGFTAHLAGIVSWSNQRCGRDSLGIVTELSPYVTWVDKLLAQAGGLKNFNPEYYGHLGSLDDRNFEGGYREHGHGGGHGRGYGGGRRGHGYGRRGGSHGGYGGSHGGGYGGGYGVGHGSGYGADYGRRSGYGGSGYGGGRGLYRSSKEEE